MVKITSIIIQKANNYIDDQCNYIGNKKTDFFSLILFTMNDEVEITLVKTAIAAFAVQYVAEMVYDYFSFAFQLPPLFQYDREVFDDLLADRMWKLFRLYISIEPENGRILKFYVSHNLRNLE